MKAKGLTLMELVVALSVLGMILAGGTALLMSSWKAVHRIQTESLAQEEMINLFRFADRDMKNIVIDPEAANVYTATLLCSTGTKSLGGAAIGSRVAKQTGSPCMEIYSAGVSSEYRVVELQFNRVNSSVDPERNETVTYYYSQKNLSGNTYEVQFLKKIDTEEAAGTEILLARRLFAYADADLNENRTVTAEEKSARDACVDQIDGSGKKTSLLPASACWLLTPNPVFPALNVSNDRKFIQISARTKFGKPGATKTIYTGEAGG